MKKGERAEINDFLKPFMEEINLLNQKRLAQVKRDGKIDKALERKLENLKKRILEAKKHVERQRMRM